MRIIPRKPDGAITRDDRVWYLVQPFDLLAEIAGPWFLAIETIYIPGSHCERIHKPGSGRERIHTPGSTEELIASG